MSISFQTPPNALGGDLVWWRESSSHHTLVTIYGVIEELNAIALGTLPPLHLELALFTAEGEFKYPWREPLARNAMVVIDSASHPGIVTSGLLAIFACADGNVSDSIRKKYGRLFSMVDWYSDNGEIASLHNDQSLAPRSWIMDFTEIVMGTATQRNSLVVFNGSEPQAPRSVRLELKNTNGNTFEAIYEPAMAPFTVHRLLLSELSPGLADFGEGAPILVSGRFECSGIFVRPYVVTEGRSFNAYHGGDRYDYPGVPGLIHKYLGRGEVNPLVTAHREVLTTTVNILNGHGELDDDFWVDAHLWDEGGCLIAERERWLLARRNQVSRGDIAELLPDLAAPFVGHVALNFSTDSKMLYPRRLQALMKYRTPVSAARVMAWSDVWNGRHKLGELNEKVGKVLPVDKLFSSSDVGDVDVTYHCHYRMWFKPPLVFHLAITNCGIETDYSKRAAYTLKLHNRRGETLQVEGDLALQATDYGRVAKFFPAVSEFPGQDAIFMATIDSPADLAVMQLTEHERSGVYSAEHFMASGSYHDGKYYWICGW
jgi:hypothetical protein